ncbi:hypothetical protein ACV7KM_005311, partial [Escherichia coli]
MDGIETLKLNNAVNWVQRRWDGYTASVARSSIRVKNTSNVIICFSTAVQQLKLPGDANKGDTVEITFEDENGDEQKVTLEKGDNGWTSSNPALIPDSQGDTATIAPDTVKDNSEVTAVAKDPAGNESTPVTVTSKTDGVADAPVLTIPEVADSVANAAELKDGLQAEVKLPAGTVEGAVITLTVTHPDQSTENVTHNVTGDEVTAGKVSMDIPEDAVVDGQNSVSVSLTQGS